MPTNTPNTNGIATQPVPPRRVNPNREYVAATRGTIGYLAGRARTLPQYVDDLTKDFGIDLYDRMMKDPQVYASVSTLVRGVLAEGWYLAATVDDESDPEHEVSTQIKDFWQRSLDALPGIVEQITTEVLEGGISGGHKLAEVTTDFGRGEDSDRYVLKSIKTKERGTYAFVVDRFMNLVGLRALTPDKGPYDDAPAAKSPEQTSIASAAADPGAVYYNILPPDKFAIFTWNPKGNDPRGQAALNTAYDPWFGKKQGQQEEMKFIAQATVPSLVGFTPEGAGTTQTTDDLGNVTGDTTTLVTPEQKMADRLAEMKNGSVAAFPNGSDVKQFIPAGDGSIFANFFAYKDKQISLAITMQVLATNEAQFQTRAAAQTHKTLLDVVIDYIRTLATVYWRKLFFNITKLNFGEDVARKHTTWLLFGAAAEGQLAGNAPAVVALHSSGYLSPNQYVWADEQLGAPPREGPPPTPPTITQKTVDGQGNVTGAFSVETDADGKFKIRGSALPLTPLDRQSLSTVTDADLSDAIRFWRGVAPDPLKRLLDAKTDTGNPK
jgi:hypothetical protein